VEGDEQVRVGVLTGGGDCPGLNAVIRAIVNTVIRREGGTTLGFRNGWQGVVENNAFELSLREVSGILPRGGTILGTSRTNPVATSDGVARARETFAAHRLTGLIAIGGEDTLGGASRLCDAGLQVVGVPKTIDNDLSGTDYTFGFDTAVNIATEAIDRLHTTAESHHRVMIVEVMGRNTGWIAVEAGIAGGADYIAIPEVPVDIDAICQAVRARYDRGKGFSIVVVAEGATVAIGATAAIAVHQDERRDAYGHVRLGGIGKVLADAIEERTGFETRYIVLGHVLRGGTPSAFDRILATRFGVAAVDLVAGGRFGRMVALRGVEIVDIPLSDAVSKRKTVDPDLYRIASIFSG
jgi:6-phosphofructokinase 1